MQVLAIVRSTAECGRRDWDCSHEAVFSKHFVHFKELAALTRNTLPVSKTKKPLRKPRWKNLNLVDLGYPIRGRDFINGSIAAASTPSE